MIIGWAWQAWQESAGGGYTFVTDVLAGALGCPTKPPFANVLVRLDDSAPPRGMRFDGEISSDPPLPARAGRGLLKFIQKKLPRPGEEPRLFGGIPLKHQIDLLVFVYPGYLKNAEVPQMTVVWDLAHRYLPLFPEISHNGAREHRELFYQELCRNADRIIVGTQRGVEEVSAYFGVDRTRIGKIPHPTPASFLCTQTGPGSGTDREPFFVYPAQFWAHKNHLTLVRAWSLLKQFQSPAPRLVFTGRDYGNENWLKSRVRSLGLENLVEFKGFVPREELNSLYQTATGLVYPSLFGPENLPPLEAMASGCPVIVSDYPGAREQFGDSAIYVSPTNHEAWAQSVTTLLKNREQREQMARAGLKRARSFGPPDFGRRLWEEIQLLADYRSLWETTSDQ